MNQQSKYKSVVLAKELKNKLSAAYGKSRQSSIPHFFELWDLKELAILEKQETVEVPKAWLNALDYNLRDIEIDKAC